MHEDLEQLKQRLSLLEYLQRRKWTGRRASQQQEFVGLCPLHPETRPSFYVNTRKNLFYCHGCGRGGDLIRFVELSLRLSFRESIARLQQELTPAPTVCWIKPRLFTNFSSSAIRKRCTISSGVGSVIPA